jgi:hypothetical protein
LKTPRRREEEADKEDMNVTYLEQAKGVFIPPGILDLQGEGVEGRVHNVNDCCEHT